LSKKPQ